MKKLVKGMCALLAVFLLCAGLRLGGALPPDTGEYIEEKYAGWSGVLQACVCSRWQAGGSFVRWLNRCADAFERSHDGVYIEFMSCEEQHIGGIREIYTPDMLFFSPGVFRDADATAVCLGGYALACNRALTDEAGLHAAAIQPDSAGLCYSAATISLLSGSRQAEPAAPEPAMDIGLPAGAADGDPLSRFIAGEIPCLAVSSADVCRLQKLRDAGRGPDWALSCAGMPAFTDQLLYAAAAGDLSDDGRAETIRAFIAFLLEEDCQAMLSDIGALPVRGSIYPAHSPHAAMEAALAGGDYIAPPPFSEYCAADCGEIVRAFLSGETDAESALHDIFSARGVQAA